MKKKERKLEEQKRKEENEIKLKKKYLIIYALQVDPTYVPKVVVKGITWNSISLGWDSPPLDKMPNIRDYITYYKITRETSLEEVKPTLRKLFFFVLLSFCDLLLCCCLCILLDWTKQKRKTLVPLLIFCSIVITHSVLKIS